MHHSLLQSAKGIKCWIGTCPPEQPCHRIRTSSRTGSTLVTSLWMISQHTSSSPPHRSRVATGLIVWRKTLSELGIRPLTVRKRMIGASLPWIGILDIACLGIFSLQQKHVTTGAGLDNHSNCVEKYHKLAGVINFACGALSLPASAMSIFWEPMRKRL